MDNTVIRPFQELLIDGFDNILAYNEISLKLYFTTLQPLEFTEVDKELQDKETIEEETGVEMEQTKLSKQLEDFGEDEDLEGWQLIDERKVNYDEEEELDYQINALNKKPKSLLSKIWNFAKGKKADPTTGTARPNSKSSQDEDIDDVQFKVRYQYAPLVVSDNSREFCDKMVTAKKIYRKEDIQLMANVEVNPGWGPEGADTYNIWFYKGGGDCHHFWMRKTYMQKGKGNIDIKSPLVPTISVNKARKEGFKPEVNDKLVATRPTDMPNEGFLPTNKRR
jgi:hypothetical protein